MTSRPEHIRLDMPGANKDAPRRKVNYATLKRILALARPELPMLALATIALLVSSAGNLAMPAFAGSVVGSIAEMQPGGQDKVLQAVQLNTLYLFGIICVSAVATLARSIMFTLVGERVVARLRRRVFSAVIEQDVAFFDSRRTGELTNRLASDCTTLSNTASVNVSMFLRFTLQTCAGVAILFVLSWKLTLVMLACIPLVAIGASAFGRWVRGISRAAQDALADAGEVAQQSFAGIRTVRAFAGEGFETGRYSGEIDKYYAIAARRAWVLGFFRSGVSLAGGSSMCAVLFYGSALVIAGELATGHLISFVMYTVTVFAGFAMVTGLYADLMKAMGASERVFELLSLPPSINQRGGEPTTIEGQVSVRGVSFAYPSRPHARVLSDLSVDVAPGQVVALVGPSGSGKSTIAHLLQRLYEVDGGSVEIDGTDVRAMDPKQLRRAIGTVHQEPVLFAMSVADNIRYGQPAATDEEVERAARHSNAFDFVDGFPDGFQTIVGERGVLLSGGQKQRIAIARALLVDPRILLLDEATSALDAESEHLVQTALERLMVGRTTVVIAHRLSTVQRADRVVVVDGGRVAESGTHDELMEANGVYRGLIERQLLLR